MEEIVKRLQFIGLTENESRVYLELCKKGELTGYEISKYIGVTRANVYSCLSNMVEKGFVHKLEGSPVKFIAVDINEVSFKVEKDVKEATGYLKNHVPERVQEAAPFITIEGDKNIIDRLKYMIAEAERTLYLDAWAEEIVLLEELLVDAQSRGLKVVLVSVGEMQSNIKFLYNHGRDEKWSQNGARPVRLIKDSHEALTGEIGKGKESKAIYSQNDSLVDLAKESMVHEIMLLEIKKEFQATLEAKFGKNLVKLRDKISSSRHPIISED